MKIISQFDIGVILGFLLGFLVCIALLFNFIDPIHSTIDINFPYLLTQEGTFCGIFLTAMGDFWGEDVAKSTYITYKFLGRTISVKRILKLNKSERLIIEDLTKNRLEFAR